MHKEIINGKVYSDNLKFTIATNLWTLCVCTKVRGFLSFFNAREVHCMDIVNANNKIKLEKLRQTFFFAFVFT